jgi:hypothetical protein
MRKLYSFSFALTLLLPTTSLAQEFSVLTGLFQHVHGVSIYGQSAVNKRLEPLYGAGTEVMIDLAPSTAHTPVVLGLAASYMQGIEVHRPDLDLHGSVRSFPTFAAYVGRTNFPHVEPYARLSVGLADLWNTQAIDRDGNRSPVHAQTVEYGAMGGVELTHLAIKGFFVEGGYTARRFSSLDWDKAKDEAQKGWPRHLYVGGWQVVAGFQFHLADEVGSSTPPPPPPALLGVWKLTMLDELQVPAVFKQDPLAPGDAAKGGSEKDEIVDGSLSIGGGHYDLTLFHRHTVLDSAGKPIGVSHLSPVVERGMVLRRWGADLLQPTSPSAPGTPYLLARAGETIMLRLPDSNHLLTFAKPKLTNTATPLRVP